MSDGLRGELEALLDDPKKWAIENIGPVPNDEDERDRWHIKLGILVLFVYDVRSIIAKYTDAAPRRADFVAGAKWEAARWSWRDDYDAVKAEAEADRRFGEGR